MTNRKNCMSKKTICNKLTAIINYNDFSYKVATSRLIIEEFELRNKINIKNTTSPK